MRCGSSVAFLSHSVHESPCGCQRAGVESAAQAWHVFWLCRYFEVAARGLPAYVCIQVDSRGYTWLIQPFAAGRRLIQT